MSEALCYYETDRDRTALALPWRTEALVAGWSRVRAAMAREMPPEFTRDEWAYLMAFLDPESLLGPFLESFGEPCPAGPVTRLARPRGPVAVWLPNNVSLLGPLLLTLLSLTGARLRFKAGSTGVDLADAFLQFSLRWLPEGPLAESLRDHVRVERFDRDDSRNAEMAAEAAVRIVFGTDRSAEAVHLLPHPLHSAGFSFSDRESQAWMEPGAVTDEDLRTLIRVFTIYGRAGCTSPARVVLLDGTPQAALRMRDRLLRLWPEVAARSVPLHLASENIMARQWSAVLGWDAVAVPGNAAVVAVGTPDLPPFHATLGLPIVFCPVERAVDCLPPNIQTLGHVLEDPANPRWLRVIAGTRIKRFVPLSDMHRFGILWDGWEFWRAAFECVEVSAGAGRRGRAG